MSPPTLPNITVVPIAEDLAVSEITFADAWAVHREPKAKAPQAIIKVAPYRTILSSLARNMI
jgi:hypothetical protein